MIIDYKRELAEKILIELIRIAETNVDYMRSVKDCAKEINISFNEYLSSMAWAYVIEFYKVEEKLLAENN